MCLWGWWEWPHPAPGSTRASRAHVCCAEPGHAGNLQERTNETTSTSFAVQWDFDEGKVSLPANRPLNTRRFIACPVCLRRLTCLVKFSLVID